MNVGVNLSSPQSVATHCVGVSSLVTLFSFSFTRFVASSFDCSVTTFYDKARSKQSLLIITTPRALLMFKLLKYETFDHLLRFLHDADDRRYRPV